MGKLSVLRLIRKARPLSSDPELPSLEALVEDEFSKVSDGWHLARWIVPLSSLVVGGAVFLPLMLFVHPLFVIGAAGLPLIGLILGAIFHILAKRITPAQLGLRKKCALLGQRMVGLANLTGVTPALSPKVGAALEEAAEALLSVKPVGQEIASASAKGVYAQASQKAEAALVEAMTKMLSLADSPSLLAQESELARGWALPLLEEMKATAAALTAQSPRVQIAAQIEASESPLVGLVEARAQLAKLEAAVKELDSDELRDQA